MAIVTTVEVEVEIDEILAGLSDDDLMDEVESRGLIGCSLQGLGAQRQAMLHALWDNDEAKTIELLKTYLCDILGRAAI